MSPAEPSMIERRRRVGLIAAVCFGFAVTGFLMGRSDSAWTAAAMRISIVLGAIWLVLPTTRRPAAWSKLTRGRLAMIVLVTVFINRMKFLLPLMLIAGIAAWILRPKNRKQR